jgi:hypothetical protein
MIDIIDSKNLVAQAELEDAYMRKLWYGCDMLLKSRKL